MSALAVRAKGIVDWSDISVSGKATRVALLLLIAILIFGGATTQGYFSLANAKAILSTTSYVGIVAVGVTVVMLSGNLFSITIGTTVAISAMMFLFALQSGIVVAIVVTLVTGGVVSGLQGLAVGSIGANPIIVTIGAGSLQAGAAEWLTGGSSIYPPSGDTSFKFLTGHVLGLPVSIYVFLVLALIVELILRRSLFGRRIYLLGENPVAARAAALPITRLTIAAFAVGGVCAAVTGILIGAFNQNATLGVSGTFSFDAIAAALVGGSAVTGGRGSVSRTVFGALLIGAISDMLLLRGYNTSVQILVEGVIVLGAVVMVHLSSRSPSR